MQPVSKQQWRRHLRAARQDLDESTRDLAGVGLARAALLWAEQVAPHGTVGAYLSIGSEPPTLPLLAALVAAGRTVVVPVCEADYRLSWVRWRPGVALRRSPFAPVMEPVGPRCTLPGLGPSTLDPSELDPATLDPATLDPATFDPPELGPSELGPVAGILLPALAADTCGVRLGQGGGYYDRFLATLPAGPTRPATAAVLYPGEVLPPGQLPHDPLDQPVEYLLTPHGHQRAAGAEGLLQ